MLVINVLLPLAPGHASAPRHVLGDRGRSPAASMRARAATGVFVAAASSAVARPLPRGYQALSASSRTGAARTRFIGSDRVAGRPRHIPCIACMAISGARSRTNTMPPHGVRVP